MRAVDEVGKLGDPLWFSNPGQMSPEVKIRCIIGPKKRTDVLQKFDKKVLE